MAKKEFTGTATYESKKDKADAKEYKEMTEAKAAYLEERGEQFKTMR